MAAREGFTSSRIIRAASRDHPNKVVEAITVELRVHYPPAMGHERLVAEVINEVAVEGLRELTRRMVPHE